MAMLYGPSTSYQEQIILKEELLVLLVQYDHGQCSFKYFLVHYNQLNVVNTTYFKIKPKIESPH